MTIVADLEDVVLARRNGDRVLEEDKRTVVAGGEVRREVQRDGDGTGRASRAGARKWNLRFAGRPRSVLAVLDGKAGRRHEIGGELIASAGTDLTGSGEI